MTRSDLYPNLGSQVDRWPQRSGQWPKSRIWVFGSQLWSKVVTEPEFRHHRTPLVNLCWTLYFLFAKCQNRGWIPSTELKFRSSPCGHVLRYVNQAAYQSIWELITIIMVYLSTLYRNLVRRSPPDSRSTAWKIWNMQNGSVCKLANVR